MLTSDTSVTQNEMDGLHQRSTKPTSNSAAQMSSKSTIDQKLSAAQLKKATNWGRSWDISFVTIMGCAFLMTFCPTIVLYFWISCNSFQCNIITPLQSLFKTGVLEFLLTYLPKPTTKGFFLYFCWLFFQAALYVFVPAKIGYGQKTPAGFTLPYIVNGLRSWFITHFLYIALSSQLGLFSGSIIADNWGSLMVAATCYGYFLTVFSYVKAHLFPTHEADRKFSGSWIYDMFMGIEFNPRFGKYFDFKLFHNGRPGIVAWTLINYSFAVAQVKEIGYLTNSMFLLNVLHLTYVLDFFYNEDWYLRTIDIAHDHFGFYLAWGDSVWLPYMYTLQSHFLLRHPITLSTPYFALVLGIGCVGYYIFRTVNNQKDLVRTTDGQCFIWGKRARFIRTTYTTSDGESHTSLLLTSGFWGISRHFNYVGDLLLSLAMCMTCGTGYLLPYFYIVYMSILLGQRIERDHTRCLGKYGKYWEEYCKIVPYKLIPYVY